MIVRRLANASEKKNRRINDIFYRSTQIIERHTWIALSIEIKNWKFNYFLTIQ